jgi:hypothetical protein
MGRDLSTRAEVHRNQVADQVGIPVQACREGSLEVGSLAGVLAYQGALNRSRQGDLTANCETFPISFPIQRTWRHHSHTTTSRHAAARSDR